MARTPIFLARKGGADSQGWQANGRGLNAGLRTHEEGPRPRHGEGRAPRPEAGRQLPGNPSQPGHPARPTNGQSWG